MLKEQWSNHGRTKHFALSCRFL